MHARRRRRGPGPARFALTSLIPYPYTVRFCPCWTLFIVTPQRILERVKYLKLRSSGRVVRTSTATFRRGYINKQLLARLPDNVPCQGVGSRIRQAVNRTLSAPSSRPLEVNDTRIRGMLSAVPSPAWSAFAERPTQFSTLAQRLRIPAGNSSCLRVLCRLLSPIVLSPSLFALPRARSPCLGGLVR